MPNILLEYTSNVTDPVDFSDLFSAIHQVLHDTAGIHLDNCKSRARRIDHYYIGDGHPSNAFVQLNISFVAGRSDAIKQALGEQSLKLLMQFYQKSMSRLDLQITVQIADIQLAEYFKYPEGSLTPQ